MSTMNLPAPQFEKLCRDFLTTNKPGFASVEPILNAIRGLKVTMPSWNILSFFILEESKNFKVLIKNACDENRHNPYGDLGFITPLVDRARMILNQFDHLEQRRILESAGFIEDEHAHFRIFVKLVLKFFEKSLIEMGAVKIKGPGVKEELINEIEGLFRELRSYQKSWTFPCTQNYLMYIEHLETTYPPNRIANILTEIFPVLQFLCSAASFELKQAQVTLSRKVDGYLSNKFIKLTENFEFPLPYTAGMAKSQCFRLLFLINLKSGQDIPFYSQLLHRYYYFANHIIKNMEKEHGAFYDETPLGREFYDLGNVLESGLIWKVRRDLMKRDTLRIDAVFGSLQLAIYYEDVGRGARDCRPRVAHNLTTAVRYYSVKNHGTQVLFTMLLAIYRSKEFLEHMENDFGKYLKRVYTEMADVNDFVKTRFAYEMVRNEFKIPSDEELLKLNNKKMSNMESQYQQRYDVQKWKAQDWFKAPHNQFEAIRNPNCNALSLD